MSWTIDPHIRNWLPRLQAHRGYWVKGLQQNSLESIRLAYELGYEMSEFDVRMTADGELILFHDDFHAQRQISKISLHELRAMISVNTLDELFAWFCKTDQFKLNLEIKSKALIGNQMEERIYSLIRKYSLQRRILISSFNPLSLYRIRKLDAGIYRALLLTFKKEDGNNWFVTSMIMNVFCRPHVLNLRFEDFIDVVRFAALNVPIVLWTVNQMEIYQKFKGEIHGIISDEITPQVLKA